MRRSQFTVLVLIMSMAAAPGTSIGQTITSGGLTRTYRVHVPRGYARHARIPVVLVLHGGYTPPPPDVSAEIAVQERVAVGTVKSWLHRGRTALAVLTDENLPGVNHA